ncbi:MAG: nitroreductase family protein [Gracilibacteraceae bacterium]|jgi:nitroreductase|nr:nitroreductase family protein [Gracilibacteraceae bacterium]
MIEAMYQRRSIRKYAPEPVGQEEARQIIAAALLAPSSHNRKPCRFLVADDRELLDKLAAAKEHGAEFLREAPLAIVVMADESVSDIWVEDAAIAASYIQLAAQAVGINSCWSQIRERRRSEKSSEWAEDYLRELLGLEPQIRVLAIIALGRGARTKPARTDGELVWENVSFNTMAKGKS